MQTELFLSSMKHALMLSKFSDGGGTPLRIIAPADIDTYNHLER
jgi:hypothetical protein